MNGEKDICVNVIDDFKYGKDGFGNLDRLMLTQQKKFSLTKKLLIPNDSEEEHSPEAQGRKSKRIEEAKKRLIAFREKSQLNRIGEESLSSRRDQLTSKREQISSKRDSMPKIVQAQVVSPLCPV